MGKPVIHHHNVDFSKLKVGDIYYSVCGKSYIADEPPTPEENTQILQDWIDAKVCKRCIKISGQK